MVMAIDRVIDCKAKGMSDKPRRLHGEDCPHPSSKHARFGEQRRRSCVLYRSAHHV